LTDAAGSGASPSFGAYATPIVQFALDVRSAAEALPIAEMAVRAGVDWLEVGTPLIIFSGLPVIERVASAWPGRTIFADIKIVDGARKYVVAAAGHGADPPRQPVVRLRLLSVELRSKNPDFLEPVLYKRRPHRHRMFRAPQAKSVPALGKEMDLRLDARVI